MAFEQRHSGCSNSLNPKCALREAVASGSPKVLHWLLSSVGELCTPRHNSCDRHLPGFSTTTHKTKCTFQSPALVSTSCHDSSLIVLCCFFFQQAERRTRKKQKNQNPASVIVNLNTSSHQYPKGRFCNPRAPTRASELSKERLQALGRHSGGTAHRISHRRQRGGCAREETHTFVMTE